MSDMNSLVSYRNASVALRIESSRIMTEIVECPSWRVFKLRKLRRRHRETSDMLREIIRRYETKANE